MWVRKKTGRKVICRLCKKELNSLSSYSIKWKDKNVYFCCKQEADKWISKARRELDEIPLWDNLYQYIKFEIMGYEKHQNLPTYLVQRLKDIRDGTRYEMNVGRIQSNKSGYPFDVILETFKNNRDTILYYFRTKSFKNERQQINYMMAIIDGSINDSYKKWVRERDAMALIKNEHAFSMEYEMGFNIDAPVVTPVIKTDLSNLLD